MRNSIKLLKIIGITIYCFLSTNIASAITPDEQSAESVMQHHVEAIMQGNLDSIMTDYADDAVLIGADGVLLGTAAIREAMKAIIEQALPLGEMELVRDAKSEDVIVQTFYLHRDTPQEYSGAEVFVIRNGKIVFQALQPPQN